MSNEKKGYTILALVFGSIFLTIVIIVGCFAIRRGLLRKDGCVKTGVVQIEDVCYRYESFDLTREGKTIAIVDDYQINEVPEDPSHTFLVIRSFLDQDYIVREDYMIPKGGNVSCAYIGSYGDRTEDEGILQTLTEILQTEYTDGEEVRLSDQKCGSSDKFQHVTVGYEGCPVGTDRKIFGIGKIDSAWVVIFRDELGERCTDSETDELFFPAIYHVLDEKYGEVFEKSGFWEK